MGPSATAATSRITTDFLFVQGFVRGTGPGERRWWIRLFSVVFPILGLVLFLIFGNPVLMVAVGGIAQSATLPLIAGVSLYLRYRVTDPRLTPGRLGDLFLWLSFLFLSVAATYGIGSQILR